MDVVDQKLEVIRKLLAKAERAATVEEADAYNAKATDMMARHGVDSAMVAAAGGNERDVIGSRRIVMTHPYSAEKAMLATHVSRAFGCKSLHWRGRKRGQIEAVTIMGFTSDLRRVDVLYTSLLLQASKAVMHQHPSWSGESTAAFRRTWLLGFGQEIQRRLEAAQKGAVAQHDAAAPSGQSAALVLADRRSLVEKAFDDEFGRTDRIRRRLSGTGYAAGRAAGRQADVGQARVDGAKRVLDR